MPRRFKINKQQYINAIASWQRQFVTLNTARDEVKAVCDPGPTTCGPVSTTKESTMNEFYSERNAAHRALTRAYNAHEANAREKFHMDPVSPKSVEEFIQRYNEGRLTVTKPEARDDWMHWTDHFNFFDPKSPPDTEGFKGHMAEARKEYESLVLKTQLLPPTEFESTVQAYIKKAPTIH